MTNDKSLNQFYQNFMEEVLVASDMETSGWMIDDFLTSIILEYLEEAGEVTDPIMCPFRSYGLQLNAYSISEDYSSLDLFVCVYSNNKIPRSVSQTDIDVAIKRAIQLYQKATNDLYASFEKDNDTYEFAITVNKYKAKIKAVRICALTNGLVKPIPFKSISIGDAEISFTIWDIDRLYRCVTSGKMRETIEIDFQDKYGITIPCIENNSSSKYSVWLGITGDENCNAAPDDVKVVLRGATNVWFADTRSSISIPIDDISVNRKIVGILNKYFEAVNSSRNNGELNRDFIYMIAETEGVNPEDLYQAFIDRANNFGTNNDINENISEDEYRFQEYRVLCKTSGSDAMDFHSINHPIAEYNPVIHKYFESISLVPKLRETRAFVGFSRLEPNQKTISESKKELRLGTSEDWLPAVEVYGEGIFFKFNRDRITRWAQNSAVQKRIDQLNQAYQRSKFGGGTTDNLRPEYILIHTFAHLIINQLSFDCGYGSSSIRERIYCEKTSNDLEMYGVLIYTASGDSEGSLGGLVRQGEEGRLEDTIVNAIESASWCTSDPICIQSNGQGPESLNLAACHNCALLPETCCENGNRLLDRAVVVGELTNYEIGYFSDLLNN